MSVSDSVINELNDLSIDVDTLSDLIHSFGVSEWRVSIDNGLISDKGKIRLLNVIGGKSEYKSLVLHLATQSAFGLIIAREVASEKRWKELGDLKQKNGLVGSPDGAVDVDGLARLITDKYMLFWVFNILFSNAFLKAMSTIVYDSSKESRRYAINIIKNINGKDVIDVLIRALDDSNKKNRLLALDVLKTKISSAELEEILNKEKSEMNGIKKKVDEIKGKVGDLIDKIPGFNIAISGVTAVIGKGAVVVSSVSDIGESISDGVKGKLTGLFRKSSKTDRSPEFSLYIALAWADGEIDENEASVLKLVAADSNIPDGLLHWIDVKPTLDDLKNFLVKITDKEKVLKEAALILRVDDNVNTHVWISELENILGVSNVLIKEAQGI